MRKLSFALCLAILTVYPLLAKPKKLVFIAGTPSHGKGSHEHRAGSMILAEALNAHYGDKIDASVTWYGWPKDPAVLEGVDGIVIFCTGGPRHLAIPKLDEIDALVKKGVAFGSIHYGVEVPPGDPGDAFLRWQGGHFEINYSVNPHWTPEFKDFPDHPAANGLKPFAINDEWYFHMRFQKEGVTPILSAVAPNSTMKRGDGPHSGNPHVRKSVAAGEKQHVVWVYQRPNNGGRGFGFTGAHKHKNWQDDNFRKAGLNACAWMLGLDIPADGVPSATPSDEQIAANQDHIKLDQGGAKKK